MLRRNGFPLLKVKQAASTTWNSVLIMSERLIVIKNLLSVAITMLPSSLEFIGAFECGFIVDVPLLKQLELTTEASIEKYVTMSLVIPLIRGLEFILRNMKLT